MIVASVDKDEICLETVRLESKIKPRLLAESVGIRRGFGGRVREGWRFLIFVKEDR